MKNRIWGLKIAAISLTLFGCNTSVNKEDTLAKISESLQACSNFAREPRKDFERDKEILAGALTFCREAKDASDDLNNAFPNDSSVSQEILELHYSYILHFYETPSLNDFIANLEKSALVYESRANYIEFEIKNGDPEILSQLWSDEHSICRGDGDQKSWSEHSCEYRSKLNNKLMSIGYCFDSAEQEWGSCLSETDKKAASKKACYDYLYERAWDDGFNFEYHRLQTHENWKRRYGDNYIHQYIVRRVRNGSVVGDPFFKHCVVSKSSLEVLRVVNSDIGA